MKKLIKPIQHLRPLEEPITPHTSPLSQPPLKKPNLGTASPAPMPESLETHNVDTKEEPLEVSDELVAEESDSKSRVNTRLLEPSSSHPPGNWLEDFKGSADTCSPGNQYEYCCVRFVL